MGFCQHPRQIYHPMLSRESKLTCNTKFGDWELNRISSCSFFLFLLHVLFSSGSAAICFLFFLVIDNKFPEIHLYLLTLCIFTSDVLLNYTQIFSYFVMLYTTSNLHWRCINNKVTKTVIHTTFSLLKVVVYKNHSFIRLNDILRIYTVYYIRCIDLKVDKLTLYDPV